MAELAFPLCWPLGWPRTKTPQRSRFYATFEVARRGLFDEIKRLGGTNVVLSTNMQLRRDGFPYAGHREPADSGAAVYFVRDGRSYVFACDRWGKLGDNIRAIEKTIEAIRGVERWGASEMMERAFSAFVALEAKRSCWSILGVPPGASREEVDRAFREKARAAHPDVGGSVDAMRELNDARQQALGWKETGS